MSLSLKRALAGAATLLFTLNSHAEVIEPSAQFGLGSVSSKGSVIAPLPDMSKLDLNRGKPGGAYRYGVVVPMKGVNVFSDGVWSDLRGEMRLWQMDIVSPGAKSVDAHFSNLQLPEGAALYIVSGDRSVVRGPFNADTMSTSGEFFSPYVPGETLHIELMIPASQIADLELEIASVTHGYRGLFDEEMAKSGSCNVDVACPLGNGWDDQIDAVGHYTFQQGGSSYVCTGTLIANTDGSTDPLFLTANHCLSSQSTASSVVVYWNFQSATCRTPGSSSSGTPLNRNIATHSQSGATLLANNASSDFALLRLDTAVPSGADAYWAGWDRRDQTHTGAIGIHHPAGHAKRISLENQALSISSYSGNPGSGSTHLRVADWDEGTTEGGSSGSALFNLSGRIIGQLHGGSAACGNNQPDWYGRLAASWSGGGSSSSRLSNWLDPAGSGAQTLDGYRSGTTPPPPPPPGNTELENGVPETGLSASTGNSVMYTMEVPADAEDLVFEISGGSGDADLYVRFGAAPTTSTYDCRPYAGGNAETCEEANPDAGTWYVMVRAYETFSNVTLEGSFDTATPPPPPPGGNALSNGVPVTGLGAATGSEIYYTMDVPSGASDLSFAIAGGSGDADLYVRFGAEPTTGTYDCRPYESGNNETCDISTVQAGTYHVMLRAYSTFSGVTLEGSYTEGGTQPSYFENTANVNLTDLQTSTSAISVSRSGNAPSDLQVGVNIVHTYRGDLEIDLEAPDGTLYRLKNRNGNDGADNLNTTYTVNASSESANGTWRLRVLDAYNGDTGYIDSWNLTF